MNVSLYQAAAAMEGNLLRQQTIAENLAASSVPGYKKHDSSFASVSASNFSNTLNQASKTQLQFLIPAFKQVTNFQQGTLNPTGVNTDIAIDGPGFFQVQGPDGQVMYTRSGNFRPNADGVLATMDGYPLMGVNGTIRMNPEISDPVTISSSGDVSQGGVALGKLGMVTFDDLAALKPLSGGYFGAGTLTPQTIDTTKTSLRQGYLEGSNTTPMHEMGQLMDTLRHFEANQKIMTMQDERLGKMIQELSNTN